MRCCLQEVEGENGSRLEEEHQVTPGILPPQTARLLPAKARSREGKAAAQQPGSRAMSTPLLCYRVYLGNHRISTPRQFADYLSTCLWCTI